MSAAEIIAAHRQTGSTKFFCRTGGGVEYPKCGCGLRMHPGDHAKHVAAELAAAGYLKEE